MMELLSPAGSREALRAAVNNGADAVYMGGSAFNARRFAANFTNADLLDALDYCHARGVKAYVTLNILTLDREFSDAAKYAAFLCNAGVDAVIIQDMGLAAFLRREIPELPLHASTQMGIHSPEGANAVYAMGMERAVLAREVPLCGIADIRAASPIELEAFAHGALCMSFSGGCLLSSMAGERSGNRGTCAQPCRKLMAIDRAPGREDYALSLGDLCMIEHLKDMEEAGVSCIKLEGRMKRAEYVAVITRAYRETLDGADRQTIALHKKDMLDMFDRGGGCTGYFYGDNAKTGWIAKSDSSKELIVNAARTYEKDTRRQKIDLVLNMHRGCPAELTMTCRDVSVSVHGDVVQQAQKEQDAQRYATQVLKLGDTPFYGDSCETNVDKWAFLPMSSVNALRRECAEQMENALKVRREINELQLDKIKNIPAENTAITAIVSTAEQAVAAFESGADEVALEPWEYSSEMFAGLAEYRKNAKLLISLPAVIISGEEREKIKSICSSGLVDGAIAANMGQLELINELPLKIAGTQMNTLNAHTVKAYGEMGFDRVTLSLELTRPQLRDISGVGTAVSVYGRTQLMQLRHCTLREQKGCQNCKGEVGIMKDEAGREFPLRNIRQADGCLLRLLNCLPTDIIDLYNELPLPEGIQLAFYDESPEMVSERVKAAIAAREGKAVAAAANATRGHWNRPVD